MTTGGRSLSSNNSFLSAMSILSDEMGVMNVLDKNSKMNFNGIVEIRTSSSQQSMKPDYNFEIRDPFNPSKDITEKILNMPPDSDFVLTGISSKDRSFLRDYLTNYVAKGLVSSHSWIPRSRFVELFIIEGIILTDILYKSVYLSFKDRAEVNWNQLSSVSYYRGIYLLKERVKRGKSRIDVDRIKPDATKKKPNKKTVAPNPSLSGYIFSIDTKSPKADEIVVSNISSLFFVFCSKYLEGPKIVE